MAAKSIFDHFAKRRCNSRTPEMQLTRAPLEQNFRNGYEHGIRRLVLNLRNDFERLRSEMTDEQLRRIDICEAIDDDRLQDKTAISALLENTRGLLVRYYSTAYILRAHDDSFTISFVHRISRSLYGDMIIKTNIVFGEDAQDVCSSVIPATLANQRGIRFV